MKLFEVGELPLIEKLREKFKRNVPELILGIGDDAAVIRGKEGLTLITSDMMVQDVHFNLSWTTPYQVGFKLVSVNVSDIYAMGGNPDFLLINFAARKDTDAAFFDQFYNGVEQALQLYNLSLIGGDIVSSDKVVLSASVIGSAIHMLSRKGARIGDRIYVTGQIGDASCGMALMKKIGMPVAIEKRIEGKLPLEKDIILPLIRRHLMPEARNSEQYAPYATSMIDISDGIFIDLFRMCKESGVGAKIYKERLPVSPELIAASHYLRVSPDRLVTGGEDYELLFTAPENNTLDAFCIGEIVKSGMKIIDEKGKAHELEARGYRHFEA
jgi:thiamine-monophosphate kinase